jgi:hypothetical protein
LKKEEKNNFYGVISKIRIIEFKINILKIGIILRLIFKFVRTF